MWWGRGGKGGEGTKKWAKKKQGSEISQAKTGHPARRWGSVGARELGGKEKTEVRKSILHGNLQVRVYGMGTPRPGGRGKKKEAKAKNKTDSASQYHTEQKIDCAPAGGERERNMSEKEKEERRVPSKKRLTQQKAEYRV